MLTLVTPPVREPISTAEAFTHLRAEPIVNVDTGHDAQGGDFANTTDPLTVTGAKTNYPSAQFLPGRLYKLDSELLEVTAVSGNDVTFARGVCDTTPASHADGTDLYRFMDADDEVRRLVVAARQTVERWCWRSLLTQTWRLTLDRFPPIDSAVNAGEELQTIFLPRPPVQSVSSVVYVDPDGNQQTLDPSKYQLELASEPARLRPAYAESWPSTRPVPGAVQVTYVAGYGDDPSDVPETIRQAIKLMTGELYWNREVMQTIQVREAPIGIKALLDVARDERVLAFL